MNKFLLILLLLFSISLKAQYLNGLGVFVGGTNYSGDVGNEAFIAPNRVGGGIIYKRNVNTRLSLRTTFSVLPIADDDTKSSNIVRQNRGYKFSNTILELAMGVEFNFFDYDVSSNTQKATPYLLFEFAGFGYKTVTSYVDNQYNYANKVSYAIPFGIGYKSSVSRNISYVVEAKARYTLEDDLDYNNTNISSLNFGNPNTNDWYFFSGFSLIYSFGRPPCAVPPQY